MSAQQFLEQSPGGSASHQWAGDFDLLSDDGGIMRINSGSVTTSLGWTWEAIGNGQIDIQVDYNIPAGSACTGVSVVVVNSANTGQGMDYDRNQAFKAGVVVFTTGSQGGRSNGTTCPDVGADDVWETVAGHIEQGADQAGVQVYRVADGPCGGGTTSFAPITIGSTEVLIIAKGGGPVLIDNVIITGDGTLIPQPSAPGGLQARDGTDTGTMSIDGESVALLAGGGVPLAVSSDSGMIIDGLIMPTNTRREGASMVVTGPNQVQWGLMGAADSEAVISPSATTGGSVTGG